MFVIETVSGRISTSDPHDVKCAMKICALLRIAGTIGLTAAFWTSPLSAELQIETSPDGAAWITSAPVGADADQENGVLAVSPFWIVQCPSEGNCYARSSFVVISLDDAGLALVHLDPHPEGQVSVMLGEYAYELEAIIDAPLTPTWEDRLRDRKAKLLIEHDDAVAEERPLKGVSMALDHLRAVMGLEPQIDESAPLTSLADSAERDIEGGARLVPNTKPQIEFAIRSQLDGVDPFAETAPSTAFE